MTSSERFAREWDDVRCRISGGKYGKRILRNEDKRAYIARELAKSRKDYKHAFLRQDYRAAKALKWRIDVLEAIARDYAGQ